MYKRINWLLLKLKLDSHYIHHYLNIFTLKMFNGSHKIPSRATG